MSAASFDDGAFVPYQTKNPFTPWAPPPRRQPAGSLMQLWHLARNPIESWAKVHFEEPILAGPSMLGHLVVVSDPATIRRIFIENVANYEKTRCNCGCCARARLRVLARAFCRPAGTHGSARAAP